MRADVVMGGHGHSAGHAYFLDFLVLPIRQSPTEPRLYYCMRTDVFELHSARAGRMPDDVWDKE